MRAVQKNCEKKNGETTLKKFTFQLLKLRTGVQNVMPDTYIYIHTHYSVSSKR